MPRRMIESSLGRSRSLSRVSIQAEVTFMHAMSVADDQGRLEGDPMLLKADLFPLRQDVSSDDLAHWLDELEVEGCIHAYSVDGVEYLHFPAWEDFQRLRKPGEDRLPSPEGHCEQCQGQSREARVVSREARGKKREPAATCGELALSGGSSPQVAATRRKPRRTPPPEALTEEQQEKLRVWCKEKHPDELERLDEHVEMMLGWFRGEGKTKADWYAAAQTWVRRQKAMGANNATNGSNGNAKSGGGVLAQIYDAQVARSGRA